MAKIFSKRTVLCVEGLESRQMLSASPVGLFTTPAMVAIPQGTSLGATAPIQIIMPQSVLGITPTASNGPVTGATTGNNSSSGITITGGGTTVIGTATGTVLAAQQGGVLATLTLADVQKDASNALNKIVKATGIDGIGNEIDAGQSVVDEATAMAASAHDAVHAVTSATPSTTPEAKKSAADAKNNATTAVQNAAGALTAASSVVQAAGHQIGALARTEQKIAGTKEDHGLADIKAILAKLQKAQDEYNKLQDAANQLKADASALGTNPANNAAVTAASEVGNAATALMDAANDLKTACDVVINNSSGDAKAAAQAVKDAAIKVHNDVYFKYFGKTYIGN